MEDFCKFDPWLGFNNNLPAQNHFPITTYGRPSEA